VCQWIATGQWFSPVSSTNKTDRHDINEILVKLVLNTKLTNKPAYFLRFFPSTFGWNWRVAKIQQIVIKWWQLEACLVLSRPRWVKTMIKMIKCLLTRQYLFLTAVEFIYMYKYKNFNKKCWLIYNMILYVPVTIKLFIFFSAVVIVW
jgi:hypothetical protein